MSLRPGYACGETFPNHAPFEWESFFSFILFSNPSRTTRLGSGRDALLSFYEPDCLVCDRCSHAEHLEVMGKGYVLGFSVEI